MPKIRTVKPELFKHWELFRAEQESGFPLRVAFIGLLCTADREGRFKWKPHDIKPDILPNDAVDFEDVLDALAGGGFIVKYEFSGEFFGFIPTFKTHQRVNIREAESKLPDPENECAHVQHIATHVHNTATHVQARGEVEVEVEMEMEMEVNPLLHTSVVNQSSLPRAKTTARGERLAQGWVLPLPWGQWAVSECGFAPDQVRDIAARFADYWHGVAGAKGLKLDWLATWRNWCRKARDDIVNRRSSEPPVRTTNADRRSAFAAALFPSSQGEIIDMEPETVRHDDR